MREEVERERLLLLLPLSQAALPMAFKSYVTGEAAMHNRHEYEGRSTSHCESCNKYLQEFYHMREHKKNEVGPCIC